jgi:hypothetical protein
MKKLVPIIIVAVIVIAGAFYGGMLYGQGKSSQGPRQFEGAGMGFQNRQQVSKGANFAGGEIISMDDESVTVKMQDGGSKIVFFSDSTKITKSVDGTADDLKVGENIIVTGETNQDGSVTAQTIQFRPDMPTQPQN